MWRVLIVIAAVCCLADGAEYESLLRDAMGYDRQGVVNRERDEAVRRYRQAIAVAPDDPRNFFVEGRIAQLYVYGFDSRRGESNDAEAALEVLERAREKYPEFNDRTEMLRVYEYLGSLYMEKRDHDKAAEVLWWVIERDPSRVRPADPFFGLRGLELPERDPRRQIFGIPENSPEYKRAVEMLRKRHEEIRRKRWIGPANRVRKGAMRVLARSTLQSGGIKALLELQKKRPGDPLFQSLVAEYIQKATDRLVRQAGGSTGAPPTREGLEAEVAAIAAAEPQLRIQAERLATPAPRASTRRSRAPGVKAGDRPSQGPSSDSPEPHSGGNLHVWLIAFAAVAAAATLFAVWAFRTSRRTS